MSDTPKHRYLSVSDVAVDGQVPPDTLLIDVRSPEEYDAAHASGAINVPVDELRAYVAPRRELRMKIIITMCGSSGRGERGYEELIDAGLINVYVLKGGLKAWVEAGGEVA